MEKPGAQEQHMLSPWGRSGLSMFKEQGRCGRRCLRETGRGVRQRGPRRPRGLCRLRRCLDFVLRAKEDPAGLKQGSGESCSLFNKGFSSLPWIHGFQFHRLRFRRETGLNRHLSKSLYCNLVSWMGPWSRRRMLGENREKSE